MQSKRGYSMIALLLVVMLVGAIMIGGYTWMKEAGFTLPKHGALQEQNGEIAQSSSDEIKDIETDLNATDYSDIDLQILQLEQQFNDSSSN